MDNYIIFDTETNGLPKDNDAPYHDKGNWPTIVELAWETHTTAREKSASFIIKPEGYTIDTRAAAIHGITQEIADKEGLERNRVLEDFIEDLKSVDALIAHNIRFDWKVLASALHFAGFETEAKLVEEKPKYCTMLTLLPVLKIPGKKFGYKWPNLNESYQYFFNKNVDNAHRALSDVKATSDIYQAIKEKGIPLTKV